MTPITSRLRSSLRGMITYANIVATLALSVALGGVSYAAAVLPAGSVGPRQLRPASVGLGALKFPLGARSVTDSQREITTENACNGGGSQQSIAPACLSPSVAAPNPRREVRVLLSKPGELLISGTATVRVEGSTASGAAITVGATIDHRVAAKTEVAMSGGDTLQVPIQALVRASSGWHAAGIGTTVQFTGAGSAQVAILGTSVVVTALP